MYYYKNFVITRRNSTSIRETREAMTKIRHKLMLLSKCNCLRPQAPILIRRLSKIFPGVFALTFSEKLWFSNEIVDECRCDQDQYYLIYVRQQLIYVRLHKKPLRCLKIHSIFWSRKLSFQREPVILNTEMVNDLSKPVDAAITERTGSLGFDEYRKYYSTVFLSDITLTS